jgi:hypothetical protein
MHFVIALVVAPMMQSGKHDRRSLFDSRRRQCGYCAGIIEY